MKLAALALLSMWVVVLDGCLPDVACESDADCPPSLPHCLERRCVVTKGSDAGDRRDGGGHDASAALDGGPTDAARADGGHGLDDGGANDASRTVDASAPVDAADPDAGPIDAADGDAAAGLDAGSTDGGDAMPFHTPIDPVAAVSTGGAQNVVDAACSGSTCCALWWDSRRVRTGSLWSGCATEADGAWTVNEPKRVPTTGTSTVALAADDAGGFYVAYTSEGAVRFHRLGSSTEGTVSEGMVETGRYLDLAYLGDDRFVVVWATDDGVYARDFSRFGISPENPVTIASLTWAGSVAAASSGSQILLAWRDVRAGSFHASLYGAGLDVTQGTLTPFAAVAPDLAGELSASYAGDFFVARGMAPDAAIEIVRVAVDGAVSSPFAPGVDAGVGDGWPSLAGSAARDELCLGWSHQYRLASGCVTASTAEATGLTAVVSAHEADGVVVAMHETSGPVYAYRGGDGRIWARVPDEDPVVLGVGANPTLGPSLAVGDDALGGAFVEMDLSRLMGSLRVLLVDEDGSALTASPPIGGEVRGARTAIVGHGAGFVAAMQTSNDVVLARFDRATLDAPELTSVRDFVSGLSYVESFDLANAGGRLAVGLVAYLSGGINHADRARLLLEDAGGFSDVVIDPDGPLQHDVRVAGGPSKYLVGWREYDEAFPDTYARLRLARVDATSGAPEPVVLETTALDHRIAADDEGFLVVMVRPSGALSHVYVPNEGAAHAAVDVTSGWTAGSVLRGLVREGDRFVVLHQGTLRREVQRLRLTPDGAATTNLSVVAPPEGVEVEGAALAPLSDGSLFFLYEAYQTDVDALRVRALRVQP